MGGEGVLHGNYMCRGLAEADADVQVAFTWSMQNIYHSILPVHPGELGTCQGEIWHNLIWGGGCNEGHQ